MSGAEAMFVFGRDWIEKITLDWKAINTMATTTLIPIKHRAPIVFPLISIPN
jgi:hypothetical protein